MVNENTRMYVPEENHQGKRDPIAAPGSPVAAHGGSPWSCPRRVREGRQRRAREPAGAGEPPCEPERKIPAPPPPRPASFGACGSHEIPGEGESSPSVGAACVSRLCLESRPGHGQLGSGGFGVLRSAGARQGTRGARAPRGDQPRAGGPPGCPASTLPGATSPGGALQVAGGGWGRGLQLCVSARLLSPSRLLGSSTPPTSPLPLTPSEPTPGVLLLARLCGLAPEDGSS